MSRSDVFQAAPPTKSICNKAVNYSVTCGPGYSSWFSPEVALKHVEGRFRPTFISISTCYLHKPKLFSGSLLYEVTNADRSPDHELVGAVTSVEVGAKLPDGFETARFAGPRVAFRKTSNKQTDPEPRGISPAGPSVVSIRR
jgi:hypothetical protein